LGGRGFLSFERLGCALCLWSGRIGMGVREDAGSAGGFRRAWRESRKWRHFLAEGVTKLREARPWVGGFRLGVSRMSMRSFLQIAAIDL